MSLGTTRGLRLADAQLVTMLREAGASVEAVATRIGWTNALRRAYPVNDVVEAVAARRALAAGMRAHRPRALVLSTTTAALLIGDPGCAVRRLARLAGAAQPAGRLERAAALCSSAGNSPGRGCSCRTARDAWRRSRAARRDR